MWKPGATSTKSLDAEAGGANDVQLDAAVQVWDGWLIRMYLELTLDDARQTAH